MRPRVFPAEDLEPVHAIVQLLCRFNEAAGIPRGRRPRVSGSCRFARCFNEAAGIPRGRRRRPELHPPARDASMRPRVFPAEDVLRARGVRLRREASMRPRVFPAEDVFNGTPHTAASVGFNEAAGIPRGRRVLTAVWSGRQDPLQ